MVSIEYFTVPTALMKTLSVLLILSHDRRKILGYEVIGSPPGEWAAQRVIEALDFEGAPPLLLRDLDKKFGEEFNAGLEEAGIRHVLSAYRCPWQNGYVERAIGTKRRECLDHVIIFNARLLQSVLDEYVAYYNESRTHLGIEKDCPVPRPVEEPDAGEIVALRSLVDRTIGSRGGLPETTESTRATGKLLRTSVPGSDHRRRSGLTESRSTRKEQSAGRLQCCSLESQTDEFRRG